MKDILVIHHSADFDGIFCREIARRFFGEGAEYLGWDYGQPKIPYSPDRTIYILDLSPECLDLSVEGAAVAKNLVWIDHHKSAIEKFFPGIPGYRIDGVAACRLAWQWFFSGRDADMMPVLAEYKERSVNEPYAVQLAGEYDIWDKRNPDADVFQLGLRSKDLTAADWNELLTVTNEPAVPGLVAYLLQNAGTQP